MKISRNPKLDIVDIQLCEIRGKQSVKAGVSARDITKNMIRVKSSNIWSYCIDIKRPTDKTGNVYVQFKGKNGGPDDVYVYFDVPIIIYRRWLSAPSKGHFLWKYIRGKYAFAKLTGDKKTKQRGGVSTQLAEKEMKKREEASNQAETIEVDDQLEGESA